MVVDLPHFHQLYMATVTTVLVAEEEGGWVKETEVGEGDSKGSNHP